MILERPLAVFDIETTGTSIAVDRIVELAIVVRSPNGDVARHSWFINPGCAIPPEATAVHGITDKMVAHAPTFEVIAEDVAAALSGCDLGGFNIIKFDLPFLKAEFARVKVPLTLDGLVVLDAMSLYHAKEKRDLDAASRFYLGRPHEGGHQATKDAETTLAVILAQSQMYSIAMPEQFAEAHAKPKPANAVDSEGKFVWREGYATASFGKYKGHSLQWLKQNEPGFLAWVFLNDFSPQVKTLVNDALKGKFPRRKDHVDT